MARQTSVPPTTRRVILAEHPFGPPTPACFTVDTEPLPAPGEDEVLVRVRELTVEPFLRTLIRPDGGLAVGDVPPATAVAEVIASGSADHAAGSLVLAPAGWRAWAVVPADQVRPLGLPPGVPAGAALNALGTSGLTAYAAHVRHLSPAAGETVVISSASGAVGSVAGRLAREAGARTVAIVGDDVKARTALDLLGYSAAVVRTAPGWRTELPRACPDGIDAYLHMADADVLAGVTELLSVGARISLCGLVDRYNDGPETWLPAGVIIRRRLTVHGMVVHDHLDLAEAHRAAVLPLLVSGELRLWEERHRGIEALPEAFCRVMTGRNHGKAVVEL